MHDTPSPKRDFKKKKLQSTDVKLQLSFLNSCCCAEEVLISNTSIA